MGTTTAKEPITERIAHAAAKVEAAKKRLIDAEQTTSFARNAECEALNAMNAATREFDALVKELRESAPRGSDWHDERHRRPMPNTPAGGV